MSLVLFDIDGTLLLSGGAGVRAMAMAFEEIFGVPDAFDGIEVAGRTDTYIVAEAMRVAGVADTPEQKERFRRRYTEVLAREIRKPGRGRRGVMPGVQPLLDEMRRREHFHPALLTGNYESAAYIKLDEFALSKSFSWGSFGEESADRNELGRVALRRALERAIPSAACERAIVIGDTPHDITCARAIGARVLAVATGSHAREALEEAGADLVLEDLNDTERVLKFLA